MFSQLLSLFLYLSLSVSLKILLYLVFWVRHFFSIWVSRFFVTISIMVLFLVGSNFIWKLPHVLVIVMMSWSSISALPYFVKFLQPIRFLVFTPDFWYLSILNIFTLNIFSSSTSLVTRKRFLSCPCGLLWMLRLDLLTWLR